MRDMVDTTVIHMRRNFVYSTYKFGKAREGFGFAFISETPGKFLTLTRLYRLAKFPAKGYTFGPRIAVLFIPHTNLARPGRDSHPRIGVLQTPALLLGYQAKFVCGTDSRVNFSSR